MVTVAGSSQAREKGVLEVIWEGFTGVSDVGNPHQLSRWPDKSVQVFGSFGTGTSTVIIQGSNDNVLTTGSVWSPLTDPQGTALSFSTTGIEAILENPRHIRPKLTVGVTSTDLDVIIIAHGNM